MAIAAKLFCSHETCNFLNRNNYQTMRTPLFALGFAFLFALIACTPKQEEVLIPDNQAPPDGTISDIVVESYVNRAYISLLGRKADEVEFPAAVTQLRLNNLSQSDREAFLNGIIGSDEYYNNLFDVGRAQLLNSIDTSEIGEQIFLFNLLLQDPQYQALYPTLIEERDRLQEILTIVPQLKAGTIDEVEMHRRMVHNYIYDQINMGTQNFVISMFQNFLFRYPTDAELADSEMMVDGFPSQVFLESGRNKEDFIRIFLESADYYEGQVRDVYSRFLFRDPGTKEMESLSVSYKGSGDYAALLVAVLSSDEFVGL